MEVLYMTYAQKMIDERRTRFMDGIEEDLEKIIKKCHSRTKRDS